MLELIVPTCLYTVTWLSRWVLCFQFLLLEGSPWTAETFSVFPLHRVRTPGTLSIPTTICRRIMKVRIIFFAQNWDRGTYVNFNFFHITFSYDIKYFVKSCFHLLKAAFQLEDNSFTVLCWFLPYINRNQP